MKEKHGKGREVIGLIGTHHGVGVTHTGLMLAFYLGEELGKKTAFLECNNHHDMKLIQNAYEWGQLEQQCFSFHQVSCYNHVSSKKISEIFSENFEYIIMDFGIDFHSNRNEFLRCNRKIVVGGRSEWDLQKLLHFVHSLEGVRGSENWYYFIPQASNKIVRKTISEVKRKVYAVPVTEEPTRPTHHWNKFFGELFY